MIFSNASDFNTLFDLTDGMYLVLNRDLKIVTASNSFLLLINASVEKIQNAAIENVEFLNKESNAIEKILANTQQAIISKSKVKNWEIHIQFNSIYSKQNTWNLQFSPILNEKEVVSFIVIQFSESNQTVLPDDRKAHVDFLSKHPFGSNHAIYTLDLNGHITDWNTNAEKLFGYTYDEVIGKSSREVFKIEITDAEIASMMERIYIQGFWSQELKRITKSGNEIYIITSITPFKNSDGKITGYYSINQEIKQQQALQKRINHLTHIVEQNSEPIFSINQDLKIISWNKGAESLFGYLKEEAIGNYISSLPFIQLNESSLQLIKSDILIHEVWKSEESFVHKNGSGFKGEITCSAIKNDTNEVETFVFIIKNISNQKIHTDENRIIVDTKTIEQNALNSEMVQQERMYRYLFDNNPLPMWVTDIETLKFVDVNDIALKMYGYTKEEFLNLTSFDLIQPYELDRFIQYNLQEKFDTTSFYTHDWDHRTKDGTLIHAEITLQPIIFNGRKARFILSNNVTKKKIAEKRLFSSEQRFKKMLEYGTDAVAIIDETGTPTFASASVKRILGYSEEELCKMNLFDIVHPDHVNEVVESMKEVMSNPGIPLYNHISRVKHKDGTYRWLEDTITNMFHDPDIGGMIDNFRDITERVENERALAASEERYRDLVENITDIICTHDLDGKILSANAAAEIILGDRIDVIVGKYIQDYLISPSAEEFKFYLDYIKEHGKAKGLLHLKNSSGEHRIWEFRNSLKTDGVDNPIIRGYAHDVTDRLLAEEKLKEQNAQLQTLSDNLPGVMLYQLVGTPGNTKFTYISNGVLSITGRKPEEIIEDPSILYNSILPEDLPKLLNAEKIARETESVFKVEVRCKNHQGEIRWINIVSTPRTNQEGNIVWDGFQLDITERKIANDKIKLSNDRYESLARASSDGIWDYDFATGKTYICGSGYKDLFGYDLVNVFSDEHFWESKIHPDDKKRVLSDIARAIDDPSTQISSNEYRLMKANGDYAYINDRYIIIRQNGIPIRMIGAKQDITARKIAEYELKKKLEENQSLAERFSTIINTLPANIALLDENGIIIEVNESWKKFANENNMKTENYGIGKPYIQMSEGSLFDHTGEESIVAEGVESVLNKNKQEFVLEYACHSPQAERWFRMIVSPLKERPYLGAVVMHIDITELKMLEKERLNRKIEEQKIITRAMLRGQENERNRIGQELHDNVNQILVGTRLHLSLAANKSEELRKLIQYPIELIENSIDQIRSLCRDLVTPVKHADLKELVDEQLDMLHHAGIKTNLEYEISDFTLQPDIILNIYRIIQEQVNNILKHSEARNVHLILKQTEDFIEMVVTDNGVGFNTDSKKEGIGINNIINRVESNNGQIEIESAIGKGCTTRISIPYFKKEMANLEENG